MSRCLTFQGMIESFYLIMLHEATESSTMSVKEINFLGGFLSHRNDMVLASPGPQW